MNQEYYKDKYKYNTFLADYEQDLDNNNDDNNKTRNHLANNNKDIIQYIIITHLFKKSFLHL